MKGGKIDNCAALLILIEESKVGKQLQSKKKAIVELSPDKSVLGLAEGEKENEPVKKSVVLLARASQRFPLGCSRERLSERSMYKLAPSEADAQPFGIITKNN